MRSKYQTDTVDSPELIAASVQHFRDTLSLNPNIEEGPKIKQMIDQFERELNK